MLNRLFSLKGIVALITGKTNYIPPPFPSPSEGGRLGGGEMVP